MSSPSAPNNGKVPGWLWQLGIQEGEYYSDSKLPLKQAMKSRAFSPPGRVYACLVLHTKCFQQELAVKMEAGKRVPLTPRDISAETGVGKNHIRECILELRRWGLADIKNSTKGRVEMYCWVKPRPVAAVADSEKNGSCAQEQSVDPILWIQQYTKYFKRWRIKPPSAEIVTSRRYQMAVEEAARRYQEAEMVLARTLKGSFASEDDGGEDVVLPSPETERNERNILKETPPPPPPFVKVDNGKPAEQEKAEEEDRPLNYETFQTLYPQEHLDSAKSKPHFDKLNRHHKDLAIAWLKLNRDCPRWRADGGRWIPLASTFLRERQFLHPPPPAFQKSNGSTRHPPVEEVLALMRKQREDQEALYEEEDDEDQT